MKSRPKRIRDASGQLRGEVHKAAGKGGMGGGSRRMGGGGGRRRVGKGKRQRAELKL